MPLSKARLARRPFPVDRLPLFYGWIILGVGTLGVLASSPGQTIGVSVFTDSLMAVLGLTRAQLSLAYMLGTIGSACLLPWAGRFCDRFGSRVTATTAGFCLAVVLVLLTHVEHGARRLAAWPGVSAGQASFAIIFLGFLALRFWGQGTLTLASNTLIAKWFNRKRGLVSGFCGLCVGLGFSTVPLAFNALMQKLGWRGAWLTLAALIGIVFTLVALVFSRDNPEDCGLQPDGDHFEAKTRVRASAVPEPCWTRKQAVRTGAFWIFSLSTSLNGLYMTGLTFHVVSIFESAGMTRSEAVMIFLPASIIGVATHLAAGRICHRDKLKRILVLMLAGMMLSAIGLMALRPGWPVALVIAGNGVAGGLFGLLAAVTWATFYGRRHLGAITGLHMSVSVFSSAIGPVLFSQALLRFGTYRYAALVCLVLCAALCLGALKVTPPSSAPAPES